MCFATGAEFTAQPQNQTAEYGYFVDFQCRVSGCGHTLTFLLNGQGLAHLDLDSRDYDSNVTCHNESETVGSFWIVANRKTLEAVNYFGCKLTLINQSNVFDIVSDRAYIVDVIYPNNEACVTVTSSAQQRAQNKDCNSLFDLLTNSTDNGAQMGEVSLTVHMLSLLIVLSLLHTLL